MSVRLCLRLCSLLSGGVARVLELGNAFEQLLSFTATVAVQPYHDRMQLVLIPCGS